MGSRCQAPSSMSLEFPLSDAILHSYLLNEEEAVKALLEGYPLAQPTRDKTRAYAIDMLAAIRNNRSGIRIETLLKEYSLDNREGVTLMCLAEALLRIPDPETAERFLKDRLQRGNWAEHLGHSDARWVNASTWGLLLTGKMLGQEKLSGNWLSDSFKGLFRRLGEPLALSAVRQAMMVIGQQFVIAESIKDALQKTHGGDGNQHLYSFDMLGEAALCQADVDRYMSAYQDAIKALSGHRHDTARDSSISIKLSALSPRCEVRQSQAQQQLHTNLMDLLLLAHSKDIAVTIDAEEADRLEMTLMQFARALSHKELRQWGRLGIVVQSYQKRAPAVLRWLMDISRTLHTQIPVRLVKGAYWDSEIKHAQQLGLDDYPVFTQKEHTDLSYLHCARTLLRERHFLYPQFGTHNAHTVASIITMAEEKHFTQFEFQRLHGMGEALYDHVLATFEQARCRIYAPVGKFEELLPYMVRRLLENGANTSFVRQVQLAQQDDSWLIEEPTHIIEAMERLRNPRIPLPHRVFYPERKNSRGLNLESLASLQAISKQMRTLLQSDPMPPPAGTDAAHQRDIYSPANPDELVGSYGEMNRPQCHKVFDACVAAWSAWRNVNVEARASLLEKTAQLFEEHYLELMFLTMREAGKTLPNALSEVREAVDFLRYYASQARRLFEPLRLPSVTGEENTLQLEGKGPMLCISPWNFPLAIFTGQVAAALAAGNTVLAKPSSFTPLIARRAIELFHAAGFPEGVVELITADNKTVNDSILAESGLRAVMFTGSNATAKHINRVMAQRNGAIIPLIAETGGQNAMIVDSSALTEQVTRDIARSAFDSAGQRCSALRVLFLQEDVKERTLAALTGYLDTFILGDPMDWEVDIGPVINEDSHNRLSLHIERFRAQDRVIYEGHTPDLPGFYIPPTLIELDSLAELHEEVFGPVLHIITYKAEALQQVIEQINSTGFGLTLGVHSRINGVCETVAQTAQAGNIYINRDMIGATVGSQPFGGHDLSGTGPKSGGPHYLLRLANEKTVTVNTAAIGGNMQLLTDD